MVGLGLQQSRPRARAGSPGHRRDTLSDGLQQLSDRGTTAGGEALGPAGKPDQQQAAPAGSPELAVLVPQQPGPVSSGASKVELSARTV